MKGTALAFGELLWDILPSGPVIGGAPANFAFRLSSFGVPTKLVSKVGRDNLGDDALSALSALGVDLSLVQRDDKLPTGTVDVKLSSSGNASYTINTGVAYDAIDPEPALLKAAESARVICFGTLVQRAQRSRETLQQVLALSKNAVKFLDINLRRDCYSIETIQSSLQSATILKLNDDEVKVVSELLGIKIDNLFEFAGRVISEFNLDCCLVTRAEKGVYAASAQGEIVDLPGRQVAVVDTIGSGDAFSAGFLVRHLNGASLKESCEFGNLVGGAVATTKGGMSSISPEILSQSASA